MKDRIIFSLFLLLLWIALIQGSFGEELKGKVIDVHDGDTITLLQETSELKIRLSGIDAPELTQAYGDISREILSKKILNREVEVVVETTDRYGRKVGEIFYQGQSVNLRQVQLGAAWHYKQYSSSVYFDKAERYALSKRKGLWVELDNPPGHSPTPPWVFRHKDR